LAGVAVPVKATLSGAVPELGEAFAVHVREHGTDTVDRLVMKPS